MLGDRIGILRLVFQSHASSPTQSAIYAFSLPAVCYLLCRRRFATAPFFRTVFFVATKRCITVVRNFRSP